jgi:hypothetical protein
LPDQWKKSIIVPFHKKSDRTDCNNCHGISVLSASYKLLLHILFSKLRPYIDEIIGDHQCGFQLDRSPTDQIFCVRQILERKWEYNETVTNFKEAYDSVSREVMYSSLIVFEVHT